MGWLRRLFDLACAEFDRLNLDREDSVADMTREFRRGLSGVTGRDVRARLVAIKRHIADLTKGRKLYGHLYDDFLQLKYLHQRYTNYLNWLKTH